MEEVKPVQVEVTDVDKVYAFLSYVLFFGILVYKNFKERDFIVFHAKQGIVLFCLSLLNFIFMAIPILGWMLIPITNIAVFILFIIGANNALSGKMKKLPLIGQFENIIK